MKATGLLLLLAMAWGMPAVAQVTNGLLVNSFETSADLLRFTRNNCFVSSSTEGVTDGQKAALVVFSNVDWPNLYFKVGTGFANGDWRDWGAVAVDILNTNLASVTVDIRVDDDFSADGAKHCQTGSIGVPAGQKATVVMPLSKSVPPGMRGGPPIAPDVLQMNVSGPSIDLSHIVAFQVFLPTPGRQTTLFLDNIRLLPPTPLSGLADQYGQFTRADWPGKIHQDEDFQQQDTNEQQWLAAHPKPPAVSVAAEYCDVISFNIYNRSLDPDTWAFTSTLGKPCVIGEFHFGALDRGMFHPGLVRTRDQADRGQAYQEYLRSVLALPAFVGCHWFQYCDEPLTGRFDGENYNIGLVSGTDTPYGELVAAARQIQSEVYARKH